MSLQNTLKRHSLGIATTLSLALLIMAANLESYYWWLILPGWFMLTICIAIIFASVPNDSPYRQAFYLMGLPLLFYFALWETAFRAFLKLIFEPSVSHLFALLTARSFLVLVILYFASACLFYGIKSQELRDRLKRFEDAKKDLSTMTIAEAEEVLDIVSRALQDESDHFYRRLSLLNGYDVFQIDKALKLRIANEYLFYANRNDGQKEYAEALKAYSGIPLSVASLFVPDDHLAKLEALSQDSPQFIATKLAIMPDVVDSEGNLKNPRLASLETPSSFGHYCESIGAEHPNYWQNIYARIGLEYTSTSPKGNEFVFLARDVD